MYRSIACVLFAAGVFSFVVAAERIAHAVNCETGSELEDYFCIFAYQVNPVTTGLYACGWDPNGECNPVEYSNCGYTGFGIAKAGECAFDAQPSQSVKFYCTPKFGTTFVAIDYFKSTCKLENGVCRCHFWVDSDVPQQYAEVCTCLSRTVGG